jgi:hypothetical protein
MHSHGGRDVHHTDDTSIDNVTTEADENDFSDLSDEALDRPPESEALYCLSPPCIGR